MPFVCINGKITDADEPVLLATNRSFRYGDGLFETMVLEKGVILLKELHFDRLFRGMAILGYNHSSLSAAILEDRIQNLCEENICSELARVRLSVFRESAGIGYLIEASILDPAIRSEKKGLVIDIFPHSRKAIDNFSNLKSANFLPYVMAAKYAKENQWDDCLILNSNGNIADSSIANIFIVKNETILTPALSEGCIEGVMRNWLITLWQKTSKQVIEAAISVKDLEESDEVFLTNAVRRIRWVKQFRDHFYKSPNNSILDLFV